MRVIVTCGPSYEPIDEVRRITNFSTGALGIELTNRLTRAGCEVLCFKGVGATCPVHVESAKVIPFATNDHLRDALEGLENRSEIAAVFHAAALADYRVKNVRRSDGTEVAASKIPSREGALTLTLEPVPKLIEQLRTLFVKSRIVGWKYELSGGRAELLAAAENQILHGGTNACVLNGAAYGAGFGFFQRNQRLAHLTDSAALCDFLVQWLG